MLEEPTKIPSCYLPGYAKAQTRDPKTAAHYVAHSLIGDPEADEVIEQMASLKPGDAARWYKIGMNAADPAERDKALRDAPPALCKFLNKLDTPPDWVDFAAYTPGIRMFHRNSQLVLGAFVGGTLIEGFSTNISKSFFITGRVREYGVRRLKQNNRHMVEIFMPGGLERGGDGWKLSVRIRLVHAKIRYLLNNAEDWDAEAWGVPISSAHMGFSIAAFSARLLKHLKSLGAEYSLEERQSFMQVWRYSGFLMGVPETILYRDEEEALKIFYAGRMCEPANELESIAMANALINSAPLVIGVTKPQARYALARYVYRVSRALIGNNLADELKYPADRTFGVLPLFRLQSRYHGVVERLFRSKKTEGRFSRFTALIEASAFDIAGINYQLPAELYAEEEDTEW